MTTSGGFARDRLLPVAIERALRKGRWELRMKLVDPESGAEAIVTEVVDVPAADAIDVAGTRLVFLAGADSSFTDAGK